MNKKLPPKTRNEFIVSIFAWQSRPWCHVCFVKIDRLECEIKVSLGHYYEFYQHHTPKLY